MPEFLLQVHRQAAPWATPCPAEANWVTSVTVLFHSGLLGAYNLPGSSEMHLRWGNTSVLYITFSFFYWFQLEKGQFWRSTNKCRSYTALWQTSKEDANSASLLAHLAYFCLLPVLRESHDPNPKRSGWCCDSRLLGQGKADIPHEAKEIWTLTYSIFSFFGGSSWTFLVWAIAEEGFPSNLSVWQLKDLELWGALELSSGPSSVFWSHTTQHSEGGALQSPLLDLLHKHW